MSAARVCRRRKRTTSPLRSPRWPAAERPAVPRRLCALSVDLDETPNYFKIHALPSPDPASPAANAVYDAALARLEGFAASHDLPLTLFAIGEDLARPANALALRGLCDRGHAVENHSFGHRYDLTRLPPKAI